MAEEIVDIVDKNGKVLRQATKSLAHKEGLLHRTVIGCLRYGDDWAVVRQASHKQDAGQLVAPVGGHVKAGETQVEALLRESEEEIGTRNITHRFIGEGIFHRHVIGRDENHLFTVFEITTTDKIKLNEESVSIKKLSVAQLKAAIADNPKSFGDAHYFILEKFWPDYLPKDWVKRYS